MGKVRLLAMVGVFLLMVGCARPRQQRATLGEPSEALLQQTARVVHDHDLEGLTRLLDEHPEVLTPIGGRIYPLELAIETDQPEVAALLLKRGLNPNLKDEQGETPLHRALGGRGRVLKVLLAAGASPDLVDQEGRTPLHRAAALGMVEAARHLLEAGAGPNQRDREGNTPLHLAAESDEELVDLLLYHGAAIEAANKEQQSPLYRATLAGKPDCVALLLARGANLAVTPSPLAIARQQLEQARQSPTEGFDQAVLDMVAEEIKNRTICLSLLEEPGKVHVGSPADEDPFAVPAVEVWPWVKNPQSRS
ncbi:MAG: ankyrin repeat domain-containing protein [Candidatus Eremiobacteraeota bacterium]|nr:ankyrin repeat domain-containing protein [Candidatus Eremiobacteraeota bacterium]